MIKWSGLLSAWEGKGMGELNQYKSLSGKQHQLTYHIYHGLSQSRTAEGMHSQSIQDASTVVAQPSPEAAPLMLAGSSIKPVCGFFFLLLQTALGWSLGWSGREQELLGVILGALASSGIGRSVPLPKPGTASPGAGHRNPNPFKGDKPLSCLEVKQGMGPFGFAAL